MTCVIDAIFHLPQWSVNQRHSTACEKLLHPKYFVRVLTDPRVTKSQVAFDANSLCTFSMANITSSSNKSSRDLSAEASCKERANRRMPPSRRSGLATRYPIRPVPDIAERRRRHPCDRVCVLWVTKSRPAAEVLLKIDQLTILIGIGHIGRTILQARRTDPDGPSKSRQARPRHIAQSD